MLPLPESAGVYSPTKNIPRLIRAFRTARRKSPDVVPPQLRLAGRLGWERGIPLNGASDVAVLGHISDAELVRLFAACAAFVWPSFYEGFGLPVHEAMLAGAPVLCADLPVNHEIAGDLVMYGDSSDDEAFAQAIIERCRRPAPSPQRVAEFLASFTAEAAGRALLETYQKAAST
jgi:glycosyltransferase involved in cell wall biosynthesis